MTAQTPQVVSWFVQRCAALYPQLRPLTRREIQALLSKSGASDKRERKGGEPHATVSESSLADILAPVFDAMGGQFGVWQPEAQEEALPMAALLPGMGVCIVHSRTSGGLWVIDTPEGAHTLHLLPAGGQYAPLAALAVRHERSGTATALFREIVGAQKSVFLQVALASVIANLLALGASLYSMQVYDRVIPTQGLSTLAVLTTGVLIAALLELIVKAARSSLLVRAVKEVDLELSHRIFQRVLGIRMDQFPASVGTLSAQLRGYESIRAFASSAALYLAVDAPFALMFLAVILLLAGPYVAAIPLIFFVIALSIGMLYRRRIAAHATESTLAANHKLGLLVETVENAESIKAAGAGWRQLTRWNSLNRQAAEDDLSIRRYSENAGYFSAFAQQVSYILLIGVGAWIASTGTTLTTGALIACSILSGRVLAPVGALPGLIVQWAHAHAAMLGLEQVFMRQSDNHQIIRPLTPARVAGDYQISEVRFSYPDRPETIALEKLRIRAGEKVAILGMVGSGKSTLLKLLAGLYMPQQGRVLLDGLDLQQISRNHLSEHLGYCPQEVRLVAGTLRDNLTLGLPAVNEDDILLACQKTGLSQLVAAHPKGLDLPIAEGGAGVSGGQKQLVAIARLLLARPAVWLLDEPTAAMDELTEQRSLAALSSAVGADQTLVVVTHKPLLLGLVNRLIVISPGGIMLDGSRDLVLEKLRQGAAPPQVQAMHKQKSTLETGTNA